MYDNESVKLLKRFLGFKAKAAHGIPWTEEERSTLELCLEKKGVICVLAACCILASRRPEGCPRSLGVIRNALERQKLPAYVELSVYEALTHVEPHQLAGFYDTTFLFIEGSLRKRAINLDNTIVLLGNLARAGQARALALLRMLVCDPEPGVGDNASLVLRGMGAY